MKYATGIQREVEKMHPNRFQFILKKDPGVTGNLEVFVGKRSKDRLN